MGQVGFFVVRHDPHRGVGEQMAIGKRERAEWSAVAVAVGAPELNGPCLRNRSTRAPNRHRGERAPDGAADDHRERGRDGECSQAGMPELAEQDLGEHGEHDPDGARPDEALEPASDPSPYVATATSATDNPSPKKHCHDTTNPGP